MARGLAGMAAVASDGEDRISALPDDALHHILFFLPSDDAVRTCVLARRWRHLWGSTRSLRVTPRPYSDHRHRGWGPWTASTLTKFVNHFLLLRGATVPLHECDILCGELLIDYEEDREDFPHAYKHQLDEERNLAACLWIRHAVANWQARVLRVRFKARRRLCLDDVPPLTSPFPTKAELTDVTFKDSTRGIDFSGCPALEDLTMSGCAIYSDRISSTSLAHLTIEDGYFYGETRTRISTPRLLSLELSVLHGRAPLLDKMPLLVEASVTLEGLCYDRCDHNVCKHGSEGVYLENLTSCDSCYGRDVGSSVVLQALSEATDLE